MYYELMKTKYHDTLRKKSMLLSATSWWQMLSLFLNFHVNILEMYYALMKKYYRITFRKKSIPLSATSWQHISY